MKAVLLENINSFKILDLPSPICGAGDVVVDVQACALCSTDVKIVNSGHRDLVLPRVLGHEISGIISRVGHKVGDFRVGDRVQIAPGITCGKCVYCRQGNDNMCNSMRILGFHIDGGLSEKLLVPEDGLLTGVINTIPDGLSFEEAALAEPLACCINAMEAGSFSRGDTVLIFGGGPMGCLLAQVLRVHGASDVIAVEKDEHRFEIVSDFVDSALLWKNNDVFEEIKKKTKGRGVDFVISACNDSVIPERGIRALKKRGRIVFFSGLKGQEAIKVDHNLIHYKELMIRGAYGCSIRQNKEALALLSSRRIDAKQIITHRFSLDEIESALDVVTNRKGMKVVINSYR